MNELDAPAPRRRRWGRSLVMWLVVPSIAAMLLVLAGIHLAARNTEAWYTEAVRFVVGLF